MASDLKTQMLERLIDAGSWLMRHELVVGLSSSSPLAIEDALADLVIEGKAEFRQAGGYRLAGGALARRAAYLLRTERKGRAVFGQQDGANYRVGVAEMRQLGARLEKTLVMYEVAMPMPPSGPKHLEQHMRQVWGVVGLVGLAMAELAEGAVQ
jgi:hypothetical protein